MIPDDPFLGQPIYIGNQVQAFPFEEANLPFLYTIQYQNYKKGSFYEQRLNIQKYIEKIILEFNNNIQYSQKELIKDLRLLHDSDPISNHRYKKKLNVCAHHAKNPPGLSLVEGLSFLLEDGPISDNIKLPNKLYHAIKHLLKKRKNISIHNMINWLVAGEERFLCPNLYRAILQTFNLSGINIYDPEPDYGSKAIAATLENCNYHSDNTAKLTKLAQFLGTNYYPNNLDSYDCILIDRRFSKNHALIDIKELLKLTGMLIVYISNGEENLVPKPDRIVPIVLCIDKIGYLYLYA